MLMMNILSCVMVRIIFNILSFDETHIGKLFTGNHCNNLHAARLMSQVIYEKLQSEIVDRSSSLRQSTVECRVCQKYGLRRTSYKNITNVKPLFDTLNYNVTAWTLLKIVNFILCSFYLWFNNV